MRLAPVVEDHVEDLLVLAVDGVALQGLHLYALGPGVLLARHFELFFLGGKALDQIIDGDALGRDVVEHTFTLLGKGRLHPKSQQAQRECAQRTHQRSSCHGFGSLPPFVNSMQFPRSLRPIRCGAAKGRCLAELLTAVCRNHCATERRDSRVCESKLARLASFRRIGEGNRFVAYKRGHRGFFIPGLYPEHSTGRLHFWRRHRAVLPVFYGITMPWLLRPWLAGARIRRLEALRCCRLR